MPDIVICENRNHLLFEPLFSDRDNKTIWINTYEEFESFDWDKEDSRIFVLAEICWKNHKYSDFYGFELVKQLRIKKIPFPIFICSFAPKSFFLKLQAPIFQILRVSFSHPFLELPLRRENHLTTSPVKSLNKYQLEDIKYHFFDIQGLLDEYIHHIKNLAINKDINNIHKTLDQIGNIIPIQKNILFKQIKSDFLNKLSGNTVSYEAIGGLKKEIQNLLPSRYLDAAEKTDTHEWRLLLVDDNEDLLGELSKRFLENGFRCFTATSGEEALALLDDDYQGKLTDPISGKPLHANSIAVVISDLRFIDKNDNWQQWQGYDIINEIAKKPNFISLFVLTSKKGTILDLIARMNHLRVYWFAKEDVLGDGTIKPFSLFCSKIKTEGDHTYNSLVSIPQSSAWLHPWEKQKRKYPLRDYYKHHQLSPEYNNKEKIISQCTKDFIFQADLVKDKLLKEIEGVGFSMEFQGNIPGDPGDPQSMDHFYNKLIGRRIALGLFLKGWKTGEISDILKYKYLDHSSSPDRGLFSTHLAISTNLEKEIPHGLLIEERTWIENDLGISLESSDRVFFSVILKKLSPWQDVFRKKGSEDDFVEEITIANKEQLYAAMQQAYNIAKTYNMERKLIEDFESLSDKLSHPMHKSQFLNFLSSL